MILLQNLFDLLEFCAENNTYIQHTPGATGSQNRFSRFPMESAAEQQSNLGFPRMEVVQLPFGVINDYDSAQRDDMSVRVRVIIKLSDKYDYAEQVTAMDNAKRALMEMVNYILTAQEGYTNENCLICAFDINSAKYQFIDRLTYGGNAVGCELSIDFKQYIDWDNIVYGDLPGYPTFCDQVEECLNIPTADGQYVLTITGNVISWDEFSASGLVDGNGTTINGNKVDLGGDVIQDTILSFDPTDKSITFGDGIDYYFGFGNVQSDGEVKLIAGVDFVAISTSVDTNNEYSQYSVNKESGQYRTVVKHQTDTAGYDYGLAVFDKTQFGGTGKIAKIYYGSNDGAGNTTDLIRIEVLATDEATSHAHMRRYIDFTTPVNYNGVHVNGDYAQLEYNKTAEDDQDTGTLWTLNADGVNHFQGGAILNQFDNSGNLLFGDSITDGTWKFFLDSGNFSIQKRESGSWVTKQTWN